MSNSTEDPRRKLRGQVQLRQGQIIELDSTVLSSEMRSLPGSSRTKTVAIIASHDCDINATAEKDPYIEFLATKRIKKLDRAKTHTKNARIFQFEATASEDGSTVFLEVEAGSRFSLDKTIFWDCNPRSPYTIEAESVAEFADWLSYRYRRAALPNEFERRYRMVRDRFWQLIGDYNSELSAVLFLFREGQERKECAQSEPYTMTIFLVHPGREPAAAFDRLTESINDLFGAEYGKASLDHAGIEIDHCMAISEHALTIAVYRRAIHHRVDWLSYDSEPAGPRLDV
jgi:hypothetical protein